MNNEEGDNLPIPELSLSNQIIEDTLFINIEGIDKTIIEAFEEKYNKSQPLPSLLGKDAIYFFVGKSSEAHEKNQFATITLFHKPEDVNNYVFFTFALSEGSALTRGEKKLSTNDKQIIEALSDKREYVKGDELERAMHEITTKFIGHSS